MDAALSTQVAKLTAKLQKLWDKYQKAQQEMVDIQQFNQGEREETMARERARVGGIRSAKPHGATKEGQWVLRTP